MLSFLLSSYGRTQLKGLHRFVLHFRNDKADFFSYFIKLVRSFVEL